jgi:phage terminase small subunit
MGVPKRLTEMQKRFAEFIVFGGPEGPVSQGEAAKLAGYSEKRARQEGSELMNPRLSPLVATYMGRLKEEKLEKFKVTYEGHVAELARLREAALKKGSFSSAVNAEANRGKAAGLYIDRKIIKTGKLEDMTEEQLEAKMKQILDDYAPLLNAKTVEGEVIETTNNPVHSKKSTLAQGKESSKSSESSSPNHEESSSDPQK